MFSRFLILLLLCIVVGCTDNPTATEDDYAGLWVLESIDGQGVPFTYDTQFCRVTITGGELRLAAAINGGIFSTSSTQGALPGKSCLPLTVTDRHDDLYWEVGGPDLLLRIFLRSGNMIDLTGRFDPDRLVLNHAAGFRHPDGAWTYRKVSSDPFAPR